MNMTELPVFCWFQRNKDDITIVAQHLRDLFTTAGKAAVTEERLERIGYLEPWIFEYEFRDIFFLRCMAYQTSTYEMTYKSAQS